MSSIFGAGKGVTMYHRKGCFVSTTESEKCQIVVSLQPSTCTIQGPICVVGVYLSKNFNLSFVSSELDSILNNFDRIIILGDFNFDASDDCQEPVFRYLISRGLIQIVKTPTHIKGIISYIALYQLKLEVATCII